MANRKPLQKLIPMDELKKVVTDLIHAPKPEKAAKPKVKPRAKKAKPKAKEARFKRLVNYLMYECRPRDFDAPFARNGAADYADATEWARNVEAIVRGQNRAALADFEDYESWRLERKRNGTARFSGDDYYGALRRFLISTINC